MPVAPAATVEQAGDSLVHVCFCSDDKDLRPLAVAMNSTLATARNPSLIVLHLVTSPEQAPSFEAALRSVLPLGSHLEALVTFRGSSGARKVLKSPFNFAPFYLESFLAAGKPKTASSPRRLIYLDTDVVLTSDIQELNELDLKGLPAAAVEDCSQQFDLYMDFKELQKLDLVKKGLNPKDCVFNRGVFVMDVLRWKELRITEEIEEWMARYRNSKKDIYKFGVSQPPWL
ncbi:unnamed protein product, partial [Polarella glacialis]